MDVGCLKGVAVHGGVVEGRDVVGCECVLGEDLSDGFEQGCAPGIQWVEVAQDAFEGVFDAEHCLAVVAMAVAAGVSSGVFSVIVFGVSVGVACVCGHSTSLLDEVCVLDGNEYSIHINLTHSRRCIETSLPIEGVADCRLTVGGSARSGCPPRWRLWLRTARPRPGRMQRMTDWTHW